MDINGSKQFINRTLTNDHDTFANKGGKLKRIIVGYDFQIICSKERKVIYLMDACLKFNGS